MAGLIPLDVSVSPLQGILGLLGTVVLAFFTYLGVRATAAASKAGANNSAVTSASDVALQAWQTLIEPMKEELARVNGQVRLLTSDLETERAARRAAQSDTDQKMAQLRREVREWKQNARVLARWASAMRDEILRLSGNVPEMPDELISLRAVEEYDTDPEPPR